MSTRERFYGCEGLGFPQVSNYDYEVNIPIRGVDNREFRWQETPVESIYLLVEATSGGSFKDHLFASTSTGINLITNTGGNSSSYPGWIVTGSNTYHIGASGSYFYSGSAYGITRSFQAHPIDDDNAIGLYAVSGGNYPTLRSNIINTGSENGIINSNRHQVYLQGITNYGGTGSLKVYVRGYTGSTVVAYYDWLSGAWTSSEPTGYFNISNSGYTSVKYDFTTSSFPASVPTAYDIVVSNVRSGSFVTVDDIHIDAYLKKNAFVDYVIPTGYFIQMTPDLGWHDILSLFNSNEVSANPHLKTLGPYQVDLGNLSDNLDNSVTATIDSSDFLASTTEGFKKYLWRAIAISPNGDLGIGGLPQKFEYIGNQLNTLFKVDKIIDNPLSTTKTIMGKKGPRMSVLVDGAENFVGLSYPTPTTWVITVLLTSPSRTIKVQGKDLGGATSSYQYIVLSNKLYEQNELALWNAFDEHGLVADVERLPGESNYDYSLRIKDSYKNRGGSSFVGIVNGAARELKLQKISDSIKINIARDGYGNPLVPRADIEVTSYSIRINTPNQFVTETLAVDPIHNTIDLTYLPVEVPDFTVVADGYKIDQSSIEIVDTSNECVGKYRFKIKDDIEIGSFVSVSYSYFKEFYFKTYRNIASLVTAINEFSNADNLPVLVASVSSQLSGNEDSLGLVIGSFDVTPTIGISISWTPVYLKRISDVGYKNYFIEEFSTLKNSKFYTYVKELKGGTKIYWGSVETDRSRWDAADSKELGMDSIPTLFDPPITHITSFITGLETRLEAVNAWGRNYIGLNNEYIGNIGLSSSLFHPGVAHTNDLKPDLYVIGSSISGGSQLDANVGPVRNNNNVLLFSGQR